ncbi:hypothetical protein MNV49_004804 [Pseudohyphozyma bogoriensis]|nr:hypothetical protein MNV49_004804 [Pseudohyphozyma bogoriensis]
MSLTAASVQAMFAPLASAEPHMFFVKSISPEVVWTYGCPGATHILAGTYNGAGAMVAGTFGRLAGIFKGPLKMELLSSIIDASGASAAVTLKTTGEAKNGRKIDETSVWLIKEKDGVLIEIISFFDSAALVEVIEENKALLDTPPTAA